MIERQQINWDIELERQRERLEMLDERDFDEAIDPEEMEADLYEEDPNDPDC